MAKIKCPGLFCGSTDVSLIGSNMKTSLNLNPPSSYPYKDKGKRKAEVYV